MFCTKCGSELQDGAAFCTHCGASVKAVEENVKTYSTDIDVAGIKEADTIDTIVSAPKQGSTEKKKATPTVLYVVIAILVIAVLTVGIIFFLQRKDAVIEKTDKTDATETEVDAAMSQQNESQESEEPKVPVEKEEEAEAESVSQGPKKPGTVVIGEEAEQSSNLTSEETADIQDNIVVEGDEDGEYMLPGSDTAYITMADLKGFSAEECRIARNEIYARHGRKFDDEELQKYFSGKDWYHGTIAPGDFTEDMLNEYELANRDVIVEYEKKSGYR